MKILLCPNNYLPFHRAGGEVYLHELAKYLLSKGHQVKCLITQNEGYVLDGIECIPIDQLGIWQHANNDLFQWCDIIFTQLTGAGFGYNKARLHDKPLLFIAHNHSTSVPIADTVHNKCYVLYNSEYTKSVCNFRHESFVLTPPVNQKKFKPVPIADRKYITLINCNENKGGSLLVELAKQNTNLNFLAVKGAYDKQVVDELPNLIYAQQTDDIKSVLSSTKILLVPSLRESWSMAASEALCMGIPVICSDLSGLKENLGDEATYCNREVTEYTKKILFLEKHYAARAKSARKYAIKKYNPLPDLDKFNSWLQSLI